jgi:2-polyprenyl-6-methoxyphenol hydroxylase-like FAD-dependent oxidoreductase
VLRGDLRRILLESLPAGTVQWGKRVRDVVPMSDGQHELTFVDGTKVISDLLVGADGAWSRVRSLLSSATPVYAGATFVETYLRDVDEKHPAAAAMVGSGAMFALSPGTGITAHREAGGAIHTYIQLLRSAEWIKAIDFSDPRGAAARIAAEFDGWHPALRSLITDGESAPMPRMIHTLPNSHRWERVRGVTLLGDAAHLMAPSGEGANLAMLDGAELGRAIAEHPDDIETVLARYEERMFARSAVEAVEARVILELCLGERAPYSLVEFFQATEHVLRDAMRVVRDA